MRVITPPNTVLFNMYPAHDRALCLTPHCPPPSARRKLNNPLRPESKRAGRREAPVIPCGCLGHYVFARPPACSPGSEGCTHKENGGKGRERERGLLLPQSEAPSRAAHPLQCPETAGEQMEAIHHWLSPASSSEERAFPLAVHSLWTVV